LFRAFGRFVDGLGGRYITAEDVGMEERDMAWVSAETSHVTGRPVSLGGLGDPSPVTAYGVYMGMKACAKRVYGSDALEGRTVAIQGAGHVAAYLARHLQKEGARLVISDLYPEKAAKLAEETGGRVVGAEEIYDAAADIFAPCALGGVVHDGTIGRLNCAIIAGGANNVLLEPGRHALALQQKGILYAPDYAINAGGVMHVSGELEGRNEARSYEMAEEIYGTMLRIFDRAEREGITSAAAADRLAEERIRTMASIGNVRRPSGR
jgi:leucine dehydrogenase